MTVQNIKRVGLPIIAAVAFFAIPSLLSVRCSRDIERDYEEIELAIAEKRYDRANLLIDDLQAYLMTENGFILDNERRARIMKSSLNEMTVAWTDQKTVHYRTAAPDGTEMQDQVTTDFIIEYVSLNSTGKFILVAGTGEAKDSCELTAFSVDSPSQLFRGTLEDCRTRPIINENGSYLYFMDKEGLKRLRLFFGDDMPMTRGKLVGAKGLFKEKYSKLKNTFTLYDFPGNHILIFYGAAGYYRLYDYSEIDENLHSLGDEYAWPGLIQHTGRLLPAQDEDGELILKGKPDPVEVFVYRGTTGKYRLYSLKPGKTIQRGDSFQASPMERPVYIKDLDLFMTIRNEHLSLVMPDREEPVDVFPIEARSFLIFREGLLYETRDYRLILRRRPLTEFESRLAEKAEEIRSLTEDDREENP